MRGAYICATMQYDEIMEGAESVDRKFEVSAQVAYRP